MKSWLYLALAGLVLAIDQASKFIIINLYNLSEATHFTNFFSIIRLHNTGAAFSFLAEENGWQIWALALLAIVGIAFLIYLVFKESYNKGLNIALSFLIGGGLGNLIDRLYHGYVIDFLHFYYPPYRLYFPVINLADIAIVASLIYLITVGLWSSPKPNKATFEKSASYTA